MAWQAGERVLPLGQKWTGPRLETTAGDPEGAARSLGAVLVVLSGRSDAELAGELNPALTPGTVATWRAGGAAPCLAEFLVLLKMTESLGWDALRGVVLD